MQQQVEFNGWIGVLTPEKAAASAALAANGLSFNQDQGRAAASKPIVIA